jgi:hypothetical protein
MAIDGRRCGTAAAVAAIGVMLLSWPLWSRDGDNPLAGPFDARAAGFSHLASALRAHDAACRAGDLAAFRAQVTAAHADDLERRTRQLGRWFDGEALRDYLPDDDGFEARLARGFVHGEGTRDRAIAVVEDALAEGVRVMAFVWTGRRFLLDRVWHEPKLRAADLPAIRAHVARCLRDS